MEWLFAFTYEGRAGDVYEIRVKSYEHFPANRHADNDADFYGYTEADWSAYLIDEDGRVSEIPVQLPGDEDMVVDAMIGEKYVEWVTE